MCVFVLGKIAANWIDLGQGSFFFAKSLSELFSVPTQVAGKLVKRDGKLLGPLECSFLLVRCYEIML